MLIVWEQCICTLAEAKDGVQQRQGQLSCAPVQAAYVDVVSRGAQQAWYGGAKLHVAARTVVLDTHASAT
jgi:hypothetical protein